MGREDGGGGVEGSSWPAQLGPLSWHVLAGIECWALRAACWLAAGHFAHAGALLPNGGTEQQLGSTLDDLLGAGQLLGVLCGSTALPGSLVVRVHTEFLCPSVPKPASSTACLPGWRTGDTAAGDGEEDAAGEEAAGAGGAQAQTGGDGAHTGGEQEEGGPRQSPPLLLCMDWKCVMPLATGPGWCWMGARELVMVRAAGGKQQSFGA